VISDVWPVEPPSATFASRNIQILEARLSSPPRRTQAFSQALVAGFHFFWPVFGAGARGIHTVK
jgi:hypothetical protein